MAYFMTYYTVSEGEVPSLPQNMILKQTHPVDWESQNSTYPYRIILFWKEVPDYFLEKPDIQKCFYIED